MSTFNLSDLFHDRNAELPVIDGWQIEELTIKTPECRDGSLEMYWAEDDDPEGPHHVFERWIIYDNGRVGFDNFYYAYPALAKFIKRHAKGMCVMLGYEKEAG